MTGWYIENLEVTRRFLDSIGRPAEVDGGRIIWSGFEWQRIDSFLAAYQTDPHNTRIDADARDYISRQADLGELTQWWVCVVGQSKQTKLGDEDLGVSGHQSIHTISRAQLRAEPGSIGVLVNPASMTGAPGSGDEEVGLSREQQLHARSRVTADFTLGDSLREERNPTDGCSLSTP